MNVQDNLVDHIWTCAHCINAPWGGRVLVILLMNRFNLGDRWEWRSGADKNQC